MRSRHWQQRGFTLIELLVVIAILGVLAAIVIPNTSSFIGSGDESAKETEKDNVQTAVISAMSKAQVGNIVANARFGITDGDLSINGVSVASFLMTEAKLKCDYDVDTDGTVTQMATADCHR